MPVYVYWGEDDYAIEKAVQKLRDRVLAPEWSSFNYNAIPPDGSDALIDGLNQAMTPKFGAGGRLVWLMNTTLAQQCPENVLNELQRTLSVIPEDSFLLLTSRKKFDERLKSTKLLKKIATEYREFALVPPWKKELIVKSVSQVAKDIGLQITSQGLEIIAEAVGNDTRLLHNELEKLQLYTGGSKEPLAVNTINKLVRNTTQNSLQLAAAIREGDTPRALTLVADLINANEPALRILATLIGQFRTWLWVKIMIESGEKNQQAIAQAAEVGNPKRIYFLQQEIRSLSLKQLIYIPPILLRLEVNLKQGANPMSALQTTTIELCQICSKNKY